MNVLLFTEDRVIHEDSTKGAIHGILIPRYSKIKKYADIPTPNDSSVKQRHGDADDLPALWRTEGPYVYVYGNVSEELREKRNGLQMYLPQDYVESDVNAFYFVFGNRFVIHGVRTVTDDGQQVWGTSLIGDKDEPALDTVVSSISERMLEGKEEKIIVAVHHDNELLENFKEALAVFDQNVVTFDSLGAPHKAIRPLYVQKDRSFFMLTLSLCTFLSLVAVVFLWITSQIEFENQETKANQLREIIINMEKNKTLGHVKNPKDVLAVMDETFPVPPSTLIYNGGMVGSMFGELLSIDIGEKSTRASATPNRRNSGGRRAVVVDTYDVIVKVGISPNTLLVDQERIATSAVETLPWLKYVERPSRGVTGELKIGIQVK